MEKLHKEFIKGCKENDLPDETVAKVWKDWLEFAKYAFNKSHATCYAHLAYQTGYLKAHYPAEFMAANLSHNLNDIKKITQLIAEANHLGIKVMRPDVNESAIDFTVTQDGVIRFGLAAIKGVGGSAVEQIVEEREGQGLFTSIFDFAKRVNLRMVNKRSFEALAMAGAFDGFSTSHRAQFFYQENDNAPNFLETVIRHGATFQEKKNSSQTSLFGDQDNTFDILDPVLPTCEPWSLVDKLRLEKEVTGFYISGHPLDEYRTTIERFCKNEINDLNNDMAAFNKSTVSFAGMVTDSQQRISKKGEPYGIFTVEDFSGSISLMLFNEEYLKRKHLLEVGRNILVNARIEERTNQKGNYMIRISDIYLLSEAMNKMAKSITLRVNADDLNDGLVNQLANMAKEYSGACSLQFNIEDPEDGKVLTMKTTKYSVEPRAFVKEIKKLENLSYLIK
jgi:DNA polymerase-3 subunit alpha